MECRDFELFVHVYTDGEFDDTEHAECEAHLGVCSQCRELARHELMFRQQLKASYAPEHAPDSLKDRILFALDTSEPVQAPVVELVPEPREVFNAPTSVLDSVREVQAEFDKFPAPARRSWIEGQRGILLLAAAACVCLMAVWALSAWTADEPAQTAVKSVAATAQDQTGLEQEPIVKAAVNWHQRNLPVEVVGPSDRRVRRWFDGKVNFPVRLPRFNRKRPGEVNLLGARLSNVRDRQAAYVVYEANGSKLSVMVFNRNPSPKIRRAVQRRVVKERRPIYFQNAGGYNVAVVEDNGVTYSITSELPEHEMVELVDAAFEPEAR